MKHNIAIKISLLIIIALSFSNLISASSPCNSHITYEINQDSITVNDMRNDKKDIFEIGGVDIESFEEIPAVNCDIVYTKDKNNVYYIGKKVEGANPNTFIIYKEYFGRDLHHIYAQDKAIKGEKIQRIKLTNWFKSSENVYFLNEITPLNTKTFEIIEGGFDLFSRDDKFVYFKNIQMEDADPETFKVMDEYFAADKNNFYHESYGKINGTSDKHLVLLGSYFKDSVSVFSYKGEMLSQYDSKSFKVFQQAPYTKDKNGVYHNDVLIPEADVDTFQATSLDKGKDINSMYQGSEITGPNTEGMDPVSNVMYVKETTIYKNIGSPTYANEEIEKKVDKEKESAWESIIRFLTSWKRLK